MALKALQGPDGLWSDFRTSVGESDEWVTALLCVYLEYVPGGERLCEAARGGLAVRQRSDGGWGYNVRVASDGDSTAWSLRALRGVLAPEAIRAGCQFLLRHQLADGGFATFHPALRPSRPELRADWFSSQPCVTAAAVRALRDHAPEAATRGTEFLRRSRSAAWFSCWWGDSAYTLVQALEAFDDRVDPDDRAQIEELARARLARGPVFERAHAALALDSTGGEGAEVARTVETLRALQRSDGTWPDSPILRVPDDTPGVSIVATDQKRTFATAAALRALAIRSGIEGLSR